ncbi:MAG: glycosyltransferase, partial [Alphaproteobacteria bacterium]|nr:glycosyltransferase [Alphaproteobacteria bacterium]
TFVGHSVIESGADKGDGEAFRKMHGVSEQTPLLTVLPGSRTSEIDRLLPIFGETVRLLQGKHPDLRLVVPTVAHLKDRVRQETSAWGVPVAIVESEQDKYDAFAASDAALACSGTVALELALARLPAVIAYKLNALTVFLFRHLIRVKYVNLVNIMHDEMAVPELLQSDCTPAKLADAIETLLSDKAARKKQIARLETAAKWLSCGAQLPSECAAEAVLSAVAPPVVLQVLPALVTGGVERGTVETAAALVKAGFRAIVASEGGPMAAQIEAAGGMHITLPLASKNPLTILMNARRLSKIIREHKVDIVHARSRAPAWSAWLAAKETGALFVTTFHNAYGAKSALKRRYNSAMAKGRRIIAISDFVADYAKRTYGVSKDILTVVPRGVDIDTFAPDKVEPGRVAALRKAWDLEGPGFAILLPGRFSRWKGHSVLIEALKQMDRRDVVCVFAGGGKDSAYGHELAAEIAEKGLKNNVRIVDACDDMPAAYLAADVVVVPSTRPEGFGRVVIEAQAMGVPVVASGHGGAKETVIQSKTGWLTPPGDARALAQALETVLALPAAERQTYAVRARAHIRDHFTTASTTSKTLEIYRDLLQNRAK